MSLLKNYLRDLQKSRTTPLLIELSKKDLDGFGQDGFGISFTAAKELYDTPLKNTNETNLIFIDADNMNDLERTYLLEEFIDLITAQAQGIKNLNIAKKGISAGLSFATGGLLDSMFGSFIEQITDTIGDGLPEFLIDATLEQIDISDKILTTIEGKVFEQVDITSINYLDKIKNNKPYFSSNSKKALKELSNAFKKNLTPAESFRLVLQLMLSVAIDMPTVLFIKNPHKLDNDSLAILSLFFSYSKNVKDQNKHTGLSIVYAYEDKEFQPYMQVPEKYQVSKRLLDEQRLFTQRYAMLERPTSDIPLIAVKSSMFVGRKKELVNLHARYNYSKEHKEVATIETISGEPGIGKTKLVKKHLQQIRKGEENGSKQIQLTLLNQVGHTSSNTGLGSLIDAIIKESSRLEGVKNFRERVVDNAKKYARESVTGFIKKTLQIDAIIDITSAVGDRVFLESQMDRTKLNAVGDMDNKSNGKKQVQFTNLTVAIKKLQELSNDTMPIVLFIDDLQWIDEDSCEYIIEHFIEKFNVHIVATIRPSDATTALKIIYGNKEQNPFKIALLKKIDTKLEEAVDSTVNTDKLKFNATHLLGLDSHTLQSLISQVIIGDDAKHKILATTIIKVLNNDKSKDEVNTLFAVETINMLCDKKLYRNPSKNDAIQTKIEELIITDTERRYNPEIKDFTISVESTFKILQDKYQKAFEHINLDAEETEFQQKFNLMAYAVIEERLNILRIYFSDYGDAAVNTLLFSSWLGTVFNSKLVSELLESLSLTDDILLNPLKEYIQDSNNCINLSIYHYEIIEEVYGILTRYTSLKYAYEHSHSLLSIFLDQQLEYIVRSLLKDKPESLNRIYTFIADKIITYDKDTLDLENAVLFLHNVTRKALINKRRFENIESVYNWYINSFQILYEEKKLKLLDYNLPVILKHVENEYNMTLSKEWRENYFNILWKGVSLNDRLFNKNALSYLNKMYPIIKSLPNTNEYYIQKGEFYYKSGGYKYLHISYKDGFKELLLSIRYLKKIDPKKCDTMRYANSQATISYAAGRIGELLQRNATALKTQKREARLSKALDYHKESLSIIDELVVRFPDNLTFLKKLGVVYERIGQVYRSLNDDKNTLDNFKEAMRVKEKYFNATNESFGLRKILIVFSDFYKEKNMINESNKLIEKAMHLTNTIEMQKYIKNEDQYQLESYIKIYKRYFEITKDNNIQEKLLGLENIVKSRGLAVEY